MLLLSCLCDADGVGGVASSEKSTAPTTPTATRRRVTPVTPNNIGVKSTPSSRSTSNITAGFDKQSVSDDAVSLLNHNTPTHHGSKAPSTITIRVYDCYGIGASSGSTSADTLTSNELLGDVTVSADALKPNTPVTLKLHVSVDWL